MTFARIKGGQGLEKYLFKVAQKMGNGAVNVGFLENARYPVQDKTGRLRSGVARLNAGGPRKAGARDFVGPRPQALTTPLSVATVAFWNNFGTKRTPARPFFSNMVAEESPKWGRAMGRIAKATNYNGDEVLGRMGFAIKDQLVKRIVDWPADNAPLTVAIKGFNKGLIDSAVMQNSVDFEVNKK